MPPEYALNGIFSVKSDVFSFGVLVLEIISGRRNKGVYLSAAEEYLLGKAWTLWKEGNSLQLIDASLDASVFMTEILRCMKVGLLCVQEQPEDRPIMSSVVLMLGSDHALLPEPKQPGFMARISPTGSPSLVKESSSINDLTLTTSLDITISRYCYPSTSRDSYPYHKSYRWKCLAFIYRNFCTGILYP
ncbi:receptor-like serine/threonine-protein kinase SD1-7 isoform X8 [Asparagus officinalis]|nr:receptor-like serine/threonine-protein kinase SD1-7 isoform X8 [Asparagus officinalis]